MEAVLLLHQNDNLVLLRVAGLYSPELDKPTVPAFSARSLSLLCYCCCSVVLLLLLARLSGQRKRERQRRGEEMQQSDDGTHSQRRRTGRRNTFVSLPRPTTTTIFEDMSVGGVYGSG
jgi:hypothetical protein